jgi:hypothetical protein
VRCLEKTPSSPPTRESSDPFILPSRREQAAAQANQKQQQRAMYPGFSKSFDRSPNLLCTRTRGRTGEGLRESLVAARYRVVGKTGMMLVTETVVWVGWKESGCRRTTKQGPPSLIKCFLSLMASEAQ